jgi:uncharacterized protein (DUF1684 family)
VTEESARSGRATFELFDWRRRVTDLYAEVRASTDPRAAWDRWRQVRHELLTAHPQSPISENARASFTGADYFGYDPGFRCLARLAEADPEHFDVQGSAGESFGFTRFATASFSLGGEGLDLGLYWMDGYAGGLFLSFRDGTSGKSTYGAGRYLFDTVKGADLGSDGDRLILDFNFAYNPSCSYDPRWACPLAPPDNWLSVPIEAGERSPPKPG